MDSTDEVTRNSNYSEDIKTLLKTKFQFNLIFFIYFVPDSMFSHSGLDYQILVCDTADVQDFREDGFHVCYCYERESYIPHPMPYRITKLLTKI